MAMYLAGEDKIMIWQSIYLMTVIDILILVVVGYTAAVFLKGRRLLAHGSRRGSLVILSGLLLVALFYLADLLVMHAFPRFMSRAEVMAIMRDLHLNHRWLVALFGIGAICFGYALVNRQMVALIGGLEERERGRGRELAERKQIEKALRKSEQRYRELFDESPVAILTEDWSAIKQMLDDLARGGVKDWRDYFNDHRDQLKTAYDLAEITQISLATIDLYRKESREHFE